MTVLCNNRSSRDGGMLLGCRECEDINKGYNKEALQITTLLNAIIRPLAMLAPAVYVYSIIPAISSPACFLPGNIIRFDHTLRIQYKPTFS